MARSSALGAVLKADALLVPQLGIADANRPVPYVPGKVYEYLAMGAPLPVPPGDLRELLADHPQGYLWNPHDPAAISREIERLVSDVDADRVDATPPASLATLDASHQTRQLSAILDRLVGEPAPSTEFTSHGDPA